MTRSPHVTATVALGVIMAALISAYVWLGVPVATVSAVRNQFRLPQIATETAVRPPIADRTIERALRAAPLNQPVFNAHLVAEAVRNPEADLSGSLAVLQMLGWRHPTSLQNLIANALVTGELDDIAKAGDALLRQDRLIEEATLLMVLLEALPETWGGVVTRLAQNVPWRYRYLERAGSLSTPEQLAGRLRTLTALQARGDPMQRQEVAPFVTLMVERGRAAPARRVWLNHTRAKPTLLLDPDFTAAQKQSLLMIPTTPFEWSFQGGTGYVADVAADGLQGARVSIQWDGRSVPLFLLQQTGAGPGRYRLRVAVEGEPVEFSRRIGFRLRCGDTSIAFDQETYEAGKTLIAEMSRRISCSFPTLDVYGKLQQPRRAVDVALTSVTMEAVN